MPSFAPLLLAAALTLVPAQQLAAPNAPAPSTEASRKTAFVSGYLRPPILVFQVDPEFTEQARKKHIRGNIAVAATIDTEGNPQDVHVVRGLGLGLDEKAIEAVKQYRFKPALRDGTPVEFPMMIEVNFQIF